MPIVVGFSEKTEGIAALRAAIVEARARDTGLIVVPTRPEDDLEVARAAIGDLPHEFTEPGDGESIGDRVLEEAERSQASMIVIGLRRRSPAGKLLLGANAQKVMLDSPCPVLTVKADDVDIEA